jgi:hypothetical protein
VRIKQWLFRGGAALALGAALWPSPGLAAETGCGQVVETAWGWIARPETYMDRPRAGDPRKNETVPWVWAEGHFVVIGDPSSPMGALHRLVPEKLTFFAVLQRIRATASGTLSEAAAEEAIDALYQSGDRQLAGRPMDAPISHAEVGAVFERAVEICEATGRATLPTLVIEVVEGTRPAGAAPDR